MIENEKITTVFNFKKKMKNTLEQWIFQVKEQLELVPISKVTFTDKRLYLEIMNGNCNI